MRSAFGAAAIDFHFRTPTHLDGLTHQELAKLAEAVDILQKTLVNWR